jgi:lauroyl/myristoyl acyltransferase
MTFRIASAKSVSAEMDTLLYWFGRAFIAFVQLLPLPVVARLGRAGGALAFYLDGYHRRVVLNNLTLCFGREKSAAEIHAVARENFHRIGENYLSAIKTAAMSFDQLKPHLEFYGFDRLPQKNEDGATRNAVMAIGHFGNFELFARIHDRRRDYQGATTYRALKQPALNRILQSLRGQNGCLFFDRRTDGAKLRERMNRGGVLLGLLADQSSKGLRAPFLGRDCNTGLAPAILALRYDAELFTAICYRASLAKWRLEAGERIPTHDNGRPRPAAEIMRDVNRALEIAVRRDPTNWFWVHRRWKD